MPTNYSSFFKSYDIRGTYPHLDARIYYWSGYALVEEILKPESLPLEINVMHDCRYTSPEFYSAFIQGVQAAGGVAIPLGLGSTDLLYASCQLYERPGAMITASHNPKDDNGLKIVKKVPQMLGLSTGLAKIRDFVVAKMEQDTFKPELKHFQIDKQAHQEVKDYYLLKMFDIGQIETVILYLKQRNRKLRMVVDCGNAMGGLIMPWVEELYGDRIEFIKLFWELDGTFPNHQADPLDFDTLLDLQAKVIETKADLGVAFDGDADRVYFVDQKGEIIKGDAVVAIIAAYNLKEYFVSDNQEQLNPVVLFDQRSRRVIPEIILEQGGVPLPTKVGHINFKKNMLKYSALYGGEVSGHHYFHEFGAMDSAALALVTFIKILAIKPEVYELLYSRIKEEYFTTPGEVNIVVESDFTMDTLKAKLLNAYPNTPYNLLDGLTLFFEDWKVNLRMSNTEIKPVLRINLETTGRDFVQGKVKEIREILEI